MCGRTWGWEIRKGVRPKKRKRDRAGRSWVRGRRATRVRMRRVRRGVVVEVP
jgi:hypothetical protein